MTGVAGNDVGVTLIELVEIAYGGVEVGIVEQDRHLCMVITAWGETVDGLVGRLDMLVLDGITRESMEGGVAP